MMITTMEGLAAAAEVVLNVFLGLPKNFSGDERLRCTVEDFAALRRSRFRAKKAASD
jgi:hypothetical protein